MAFRYLLLSGVSDAIVDRGILNPNKGFYWRARWQEGLPDEHIKRFFSDAFAESETGHKYRFFPEFILAKLESHFPSPYPAETELDIYTLNSVYAETILRSIENAHQSGERVDGKELEALAGYLLGCMPGFEVKSNVLTGDSQLDAVVRNRGPRYDFRQDLGTYILVECKDWSKPVGSQEVGWLVNKLLTNECRAGILFSAKGITGDLLDGAVQHYAALTLLKAYQRAGRIVIVLDQEDLRAAARGENLILLLQGKYEEVRFDIR